LHHQRSLTIKPFKDAYYKAIMHIVDGYVAVGSFPGLIDDAVPGL
jgi:hypothetical protein